MSANRPAHCCHEKGEACDYGWSDVHFHRCVRPEPTRGGPGAHAVVEVAPGAIGNLLGRQRGGNAKGMHDA